jgi:hypothetical protein
MVKGFPGGAAATILLAGVTLHWSPFNSTLYPYSIQQPSSFRHEPGVTADGIKVDYFFPVLTGSFVTNVSISATRGTTMVNPVSYLHSLNGRNVRQMGWLTVNGKKKPVMCADFSGLTSRWTEEQVSFAANGYVWHLTASFEPKFKKQLKTMLKMLQSFRLR